MKREISYKAALLLSALVLPLGSCVKDALFNTPHPNKGAVLVTADFSDRSKACTPPAEYRLSIGAEECIAPAQGAYCHPRLFESGAYDLFAWNDCEGISLSDGKLRVNATAPGEIESLPGYLFCARQEILVNRDDTLKVDLPMVQRTQDLHFEFSLSEGDPELVKSVTGHLEGIAGEFDLVSQSITGDASAIKLTFKREGSLLSADVRLLGIRGATQTMTLEVSFTDRRETQSTIVDMKEALSDLHESTTIEFGVEGQISTPVGANVSATITGWKNIGKDPTDAV